MSLTGDTVGSKQCYKCEQQLLDSLNIAFNSSNSTIVLWNKYQIFIYENFNFKSAAKVFTPEYQIHTLLITNNYILCVDLNGFVHLTTLKFKNPEQNIFRCTYQPRDQGIRACVNYSLDESLSLKYDSETYFLCLNKISSDFQEVKKVTLRSKNPWPLQDSPIDKYFLAHRKIEKLQSGLFQKMFNTNKISSHCHFTAISFDKHTVYGCLFDPKMVGDQIDLIKLYSCPSEICSIEIIGTESMHMVIGLKMGTVVRLTLNDLYTATMEPEVTHLNSALHKLLVINNTFVYTDGIIMWQADNVFSKNVNFKQFFIRNVKDFILCGDKLVCTTFSKLIYTFPFQDDECYLKQTNKEYSSAEQVLENSEYLHKIFQEVEKNKELSKKLSIEGSYIAAMSLSKRQDIMHKVMSSSVTVCGNFEEVIRENREELTLTEDISRYVEPDIYLLHIKVKINCDAQGGLFEIVSDIMANSETELQVTLSNEHNIIKTICVKVSQTNFLIPLTLEHSAEINVNICLVARIPGTYDIKQKIWTGLYKTNVKLTSEHFIQAPFQKSLILNKKQKDDFEKSIQICSNQNRNEFKFIDISKPLTSYVMYVRLPQNFNTYNFGKYFTGKSHFMIEMLNSEEFLQARSQISFMVRKKVVVIALENDGFSNPRLKVMSKDLKVTADIRNFFANIVYGQNACKPGEEFINNSFYTTVENLQKAVKNCITTSASYEVFEPLIEQFEKEIIPMLPV